jgi:tetratricopeptide (TPR) repeat protein
MRRIIFILSSVLLLTACGGNNNKQQEAEDLLAQANTLFEQKKYVEARACIDSLRRVYPNAIDTRKKALTLYQEIELKRTQEELAITDSLLQQVQQDYEHLQAKVEKDKAALRATPEELTMLTRTRMKRDSLRTQCETLGGKIRYIHKKMPLH